MKHEKAKRIVVISGKGGTGKTFFTSAIASLVSGRSVFADCDVDAANLALALGGAAPAASRRQERFFGGERAVVDAGLCTGCGKCISSCRFDAIHMENSVAQVDPVGCEGCGVCTLVCPSSAFTLEEEIAGQWFVTDTQDGPLIHAELQAGGENSGKLVHQVRSVAEQEAERIGASLILIDGPPGTGCPVLAAASDTDAILLVTEATTTALHDLERAAEVASTFGTPIGVLVNKSDLNPEIVTKARILCDEKGYRWIGDFPYDRMAAEASARLVDPFSLLEDATADKLRALVANALNMVGLDVVSSAVG